MSEKNNESPKKTKDVITYTTVSVNINAAQKHQCHFKQYQNSYTYLASQTFQLTVLHMIIYKRCFQNGNRGISTHPKSTF